MEWWEGGDSSYEVGGTMMTIEIVEWYFEWVTNHSWFNKYFDAKIPLINFEK